MNASKATEHKQDSRSQTTTLNDRYGKIGISAVAAAAAAQHKPEQRPATDSRFIPNDSD